MWVLIVIVMAIVLRAGDVISRIHKEPRGRGFLYVCIDQWRNELIAAQRLPIIARHLNTHAKDRGEQVSVASLYEHVHEKWDDCMLKHRYQVLRIELDDVKSFWQLTSSVGNVILLGRSSCYQVV